MGDTKKGVIQKLRTLDKVVFSPLLDSIERCEEVGKQVLECGGYKQVGVLWQGTGGRIIVIMERTNKPEMLDISCLKHSEVVDDVRQGDIFENVDTYMTTMEAKLESQGVPDSKQYSIQLQDTGSKFTTTVTSDSVIVSAFSKLTPTYFDLCLRLNSSALVYYNKTVAGNLTHSGDIVNGHELLHTVKLRSCTADDVVVPFLTGYRSTPLRRFEEHRPVVVVWDHTTKECFVIRVPLDEVTIGDHTLCAPIVGRQGRDNMIHWEVLANPCVGSGAAPSFNSDSMASLERARESGSKTEPAKPGFLAKAANLFKKTLSSTDKPSVDVCETPAPKDVQVLVEGNKRKVVILHTEDVDPSFINIVPDVYIPFGGSMAFCDAAHNYHPDYHTAEGEVKQDKESVLLPCVVPGGLVGGLLLTAGKVCAPMKKGVDLAEFYRTTEMLVVVVSDRMIDAAREVNPDMRLNGLYIVVPSVDPPAAVFAEKNKMREYLLGLNMNAAMSLAGPQSFIVAGLKDPSTGLYRYFSLDGVGLRWLVESPVIPFEEVTAQMEDLREWVKSTTEADECVRSVGVLVDRRTAKVTFQGALYEVAALTKLFTELTIDDFTEAKTDMKEVLAQLRMLLDDSELKKLGKTLTTVLREKMVPAWQMTEEEKGSLDDMLAGNMKLSASYKEHKAKCNKTKAALQWLVEELGCMVSSSKAGTIGFNIQKLAKAQKVAANVGVALNMSLKDFTDLTEQHCGEAGAVVCSVNRDAMRELLAAVATTTFSDFASDKWEELMQRNPLSWDKPLFDANTVGALLEMTKEAKAHPLSQKAGCKSQTLALPNKFAEDTKSSLALFLLDRFIEMKDPYIAKWYAHADWRPVAVLRILLRSTISDASMCRDISPAISPTNKDLGFFLATVILAQIRQITERRSAGSEVAFDDTISQITRGLYGFVLCLLASTGTGQPLSTAWQIVSESTEVPNLPREHEWVYYGELAKNFHGTGWDMKTLQRNITWLLVHWAHFKLVQPMCNALRGTTKSGKDLETGLKLEHKTYSYLLGDTMAAKSVEHSLQTYGKPHLTATMMGATFAGKSTLVENLVGQEQKKRTPEGDGPERTVDGAYYDMPDGGERHVTLVDVPGDRGRSKNYFAHASHGSAGIMVVSADNFAAEFLKDKQFEGRGRTHGNMWLVAGKKHIIVAISKMDKVGYAQEAYDKAVTAVKAGLPKAMQMVFVPVDKKGANVHEKSDLTPWYEGPCLNEMLQKNVVIPDLEKNKAMKMTISHRYKVKGVGYVVVGKVMQGVLEKDDVITFLGTSSGPIESRVKSIQTHPGKVPITRAEAGDVVGVCFAACHDRLPTGGCIAVHDYMKSECVQHHTAVVQGTGKLIKRGMELQLYTDTSRDTVRITDVEMLDSQTKGTGKIQFRSRYRGIILHNESRLVFMDGPVVVLYGKADNGVVVVDEEAKKMLSQAAKKRETAVPSRLAAPLRLPPCLVENPLGAVLQELVLKDSPALQQFAESGQALSSEQLARVTKSLADCRPPTASVLKALCEVAGLSLTENSFAAIIEELIFGEGSAAAEFAILKRLGF
eukprot:TRINITY_DN22860_c0_g1_i1.p1 TRINITY_DN22860_c0_g1~~TRINITY_DN22860_c0_g1_i1.p1  ORF type:complete len:1565 (+),score=446.89 TRINITY_DN22860_c0_g1_i1:43-4737(+)